MQCHGHIVSRVYSEDPESSQHSTYSLAKTGRMKATAGSRTLAVMEMEMRMVRGHGACTKEHVVKRVTQPKHSEGACPTRYLRQAGYIMMQASGHY